MEVQMDRQTDDPYQVHNLPASRSIIKWSNLTLMWAKLPILWPTGWIMFSIWGTKYKKKIVFTPLPPDPLKYNKRMDNFTSGAGFIYLPVRTIEGRCNRIKKFICNKIKNSHYFNCIYFPLRCDREVEGGVMKKIFKAIYTLGGTPNSWTYCLVCFCSGVLLRLRLLYPITLSDWGCMSVKNGAKLLNLCRRILNENKVDKMFMTSVYCPVHMNYFLPLFHPKWNQGFQPKFGIKFHDFSKNFPELFLFF